MLIFGGFFPVAPFGQTEAFFFALPDCFLLYLPCFSLEQMDKALRKIYKSIHQIIHDDQYKAQQKLVAKTVVGRDICR